MTTSVAQPTSSSRLHSLYQTEIAKTLQQELKLKNIHQVPKLEKNSFKYWAWKS